MSYDRHKTSDTVESDILPKTSYKLLETSLLFFQIEGLHRGAREDRSPHPRTGQEEQPLDGEGEMLGHVNNQNMLSHVSKQKMKSPVKPMEENILIDFPIIPNHGMCVKFLNKN